MCVCVCMKANLSVLISYKFVYIKYLKLFKINYNLGGHFDPNIRPVLFHSYELYCVFTLFYP